MIGYYMANYGHWALLEIKFLLDLISPEDTVVDVGAFIGTHTIPFAKKVNDVIAFEPQRIMSYYLSANVVLNNLSNVKVVNKAVGQHKTSMQIAAPDYSIDWNYGALSLDDALSAEFEYPHKELAFESIPVCILDDEVEVANLIKIDTEGYELRVLKGAAGLIESCQPLLFIEYQQNNDRLLDYLDNIRYTPYWMWTRRLVPATEYDKNILCVPESYNMDGFDLDKVKGDEKEVPIYSRYGQWLAN